MGMKLFALEPAALWLGCGLLGVLAAIIIFATNKAQVAQVGLTRQPRRALPCDNHPVG
jgi:hypothetical protein